MPDVFTPEKRRYVMSRIRSKNTKIEIIVEGLLEENNIAYEKHPDVLGKPDFRVGKALIFCDGDFWHGYDYTNGRIPQQKFWREKIERNMNRDKSVSRKLRNAGWSVIRLWEHDIKKRRQFCIGKILRFTR